MRKNYGMVTLCKNGIPIFICLGYICCCNDNILLDMPAFHLNFRCTKDLELDQVLLVCFEDRVLLTLGRFLEGEAYHEDLIC